MHHLLINLDWHNWFKPNEWIDFVIKTGGLYMLLFIIFAETGLFFGFFLPGDSLLFVAGIYSNTLAGQLLDTHNDVSNLLVLWVIITLMGILGNIVGFWFGWKSGPLLYERKDNWIFKKKYLTRAHDFYEKYGGATIIYARFLPIIRTFAPIVAGVVRMDRKTFYIYNVVGCAAWVLLMLLGGHYLQEFVLKMWHFDLSKRLDLIVVIIVIITTAPVLLKLFISKKKQ
jgi:membrane-associated protein